MHARLLLCANSFLERERGLEGGAEGGREGERPDVNLISSPVHADEEYDL